MLDNIAATLNAATGVVRALHGFVITETAGAAARVRLRKGTVSGEIIANVSMASGETVVMPVSDEGIGTGGAIYAELVTGTAPAVNLYVS